jgi:hypothetical protein
MAASPKAQMGQRHRPWMALPTSPGRGAVRGCNPPAGRGGDQNVTVTKLRCQHRRPNHAPVRRCLSPRSPGSERCLVARSGSPGGIRSGSPASYPFPIEEHPVSSPYVVASIPGGRNRRNATVRSDSGGTSLNGTDTRYCNGKEVPGHVTNNGLKFPRLAHPPMAHAQVIPPGGRAIACERERLLHPRLAAAPA